MNALSPCRCLLTVVLVLSGALPLVSAQEPTPSPSASPTAPAQSPADKAPADELPFGVRVKGKPGYVISPYAPDAGYVDVNGFVRGQPVRCPYSNKTFLVP